MTTLLQRLRAPRVAGMVIFDLAGSYAAAVAVGCRWVHPSGAVDWVLWLAAWTLLGVLVHRLLRVNTAMGGYLGLNVH